MPLPLKSMLDLSIEENNDEREILLKQLNSQAEKSAAYLLDYAQEYLCTKGLEETVVIAELAVFKKEKTSGASRKFTSFIAARRSVDIDGYLSSVKQIQTVTGEGGPLVLIEDFYLQRLAYIAFQQPTKPREPISAGAQDRAIGKFAVPQSQLTENDIQLLNNMKPSERFEHFAKVVSEKLDLKQSHSIVAVTLCPDEPNEKIRILAALFVVLQHGDTPAQEPLNLKTHRVEIPQRAYALIGALLAGNLQVLLADETPLAEAKHRIFPKGDPQKLKYKGATFDSFFEDTKRTNEPEHNFDDSQPCNLHCDVQRYFINILKSHLSEADAQAAVEKWAKRSGQAKLMHRMMKQIFALDPGGKGAELDFNWLPILAASCLKFELVEDGNLPITLFEKQHPLAVLSQPRHRKQFANALIHFFYALSRPKSKEQEQKISIKCAEDAFEITVEPFNAYLATGTKPSLIEKLRERAEGAAEPDGDLHTSIDQIHKCLRLSNFFGLPERSSSEQCCVLQVVPREDGTSCMFRFISVSEPTLGVH